MKLYYKGNPQESVDVPDTDIAYWEGQGFSRTMSDAPQYSNTTVDGKPVGKTVQQNITPPDTAWIDDLYKANFDRSATQAEKDNWIKETPEALAKFLKTEQVRYGYTPIAQRTEKQKAIADAYAVIDADKNLTEEQKLMAKGLVDNYNGGVEASASEILSTFANLKKNVIDPRFNALVTSAENQLKSNMTEMEKERAVALEKEQTAAENAITNTQANLEASGMSRTGESVKQLGTEGAFQDTQRLPFGGQIEGAVPQSNRLIRTASQNAYEAQRRAQLLAGEKVLGSAGIAPEYAYIPSGVGAGSIEEARQKELGTTLTNVAEAQRKKTEYETNKGINLNL